MSRRKRGIEQQQQRTGLHAIYDVGEEHRHVLADRHVRNHLRWTDTQRAGERLTGGIE